MNQPQAHSICAAVAWIFADSSADSGCARFLLIQSGVGGCWIHLYLTILTILRDSPTEESSLASRSNLLLTRKLSGQRPALRHDPSAPRAKREAHPCISFLFVVGFEKPSFWFYMVWIEGAGCLLVLWIEGR